MRADGATPEPWGKGKAAGKRKGPGQAGGIIGQAEGGKRAHRMKVVVGMARRVQHHRRGEPVRSVPAVRGADGFQLAIGSAVAGQAVVLDVIGQKDLAGGMKGQAGPGQDAGKTCDGGGEDKRAEAARDVDAIGVQPEMAAALAQRPFGVEAPVEAALPGARGEAVETFADPGGAGVVRAGDVLVVDKAVGAGMLAEENGSVDGGAEAEVFAPGPVDQLMRGGVADLAKPEARGEEQKDPLPGGKAGRTGDAPGGEGEKGKRKEADGDQKDIGGGKLRPLGLACGQGDELVEDQGEDGHVKEGRPEPGPAKGKAQPDQGQGCQRGHGEGGKGQGAGRIGLRGHGVRYFIARRAGRDRVSLRDLLASATAMASLTAALAYWGRFAASEVKGFVGAALKTASTGLLAALLLTMPGGAWFWLIPLGLAMGALGDLLLALRGERVFLAGVAAFGLGHLAYSGGFLMRSAEIGFDGIMIGEAVVLVGLLGLLGSTEVWLAPRTGAFRGPVRGYVALIGVMGLAALVLPAQAGQGLLRLGAALFIASDLMLALQLFVVRDAGARRGLALALWPAYWAAQALIAWGAVLFWRLGQV